MRKLIIATFILAAIAFTAIGYKVVDKRAHCIGCHPGYKVAPKTKGWTPCPPFCIRTAAVALPKPAAARSPANKWGCPPVCEKVAIRRPGSTRTDYKADENMAVALKDPKVQAILDRMNREMPLRTVAVWERPIDF